MEYIIDGEDFEENEITTSDESGYGSINIPEPLPIAEATVSFFKALKAIGKEASPFMIQRGLIVIFNISNGMVLKALGTNEVAAGPLITTLQAVFATSPRAGTLASAGRIIGKKYGQAQELGQKAQETDIYRSVQQSWTWGTVVAIPCGLLLTVSPAMLNVLSPETHPGLSQVEEILGNYFLVVPTVIGLPASLWACTDQAFVQGIKNIKMSIMLGAFPILTAMAVGYPLALGIPAVRLPSLKVSGLGIGALFFAPWATILFSTPILGLSPSFNCYQLFKRPDKQVLIGSSEMIRYFLSASGQALSEWGNLFLITLMCANLGTNVLIAEQPSLQLMTSVTSVLMGFSQAMMFNVARQDGMLQKVDISVSPHQVWLYQKNLIQFMRAGFTVTVGCSLIAAGCMVVFPNQLIGLFVNEEEVNPEVTEQARHLFFINAGGLVLDAFRNVTIGCLNGMGDIFFPMATSFICMNLLGVPAGWAMTHALNLEAGWLFATRSLSILAAGGILFTRLVKKTNAIAKTVERPLAEVPITSEKHAANRFCFFREKAANFHSIPLPSTNINSASNLSNYSEKVDDAVPSRCPKKWCSIM